MSLHRHYEEIHMEKRKFLFSTIVRLEGREKCPELKALKKFDLIQLAAQRVVFRFLTFLKESHQLLALPLVCGPWVSIIDKTTTMYPPNMHSLSKWEIENCPWWIDMDGGEVLASEKEKHSQFCKGKERASDKERQIRACKIIMISIHIYSYFNFQQNKILLYMHLLTFYFVLGPACGWIEIYSRVSKMEIWHRVVVMHHLPYGFLNLGGYKSVCLLAVQYASMLFFVRSILPDYAEAVASCMVGDPRFQRLPRSIVVEDACLWMMRALWRNNCLKLFLDFEDCEVL